MRRALEAALSSGTIIMRAQIDVDDVIGVRGIEAALALKAEYATRINVQIVAFPQEGLITNVAAAQMVREALRLGADVLGGGATFDGLAIEQHVHAVFELATEFNVDLHLHPHFQTS